MSYVLGTEHLDANDLPSRFAMIYPGNVQVIVSDDRVLRITLFTPGYLFRDAIQVGASMEEVFEVLGPPRKTIDGAAYSDIRGVTEDKVIFDQLNGVAGDGLYRNRAEGVTLYFRKGRVRQMMLLPKGHSGRPDP